MSGGLLAAARRAVAAAAHGYQGQPDAARRCAVLAGRLDGPLRVALAGRVKAGKSTLLNALVGERLALADVGECTTVVTWYRAAPEPRLTVELRTGAVRPLPVRRHDGGLVIDLDGMAAADVERLVVDWPAPDLRAWTVIDTPGVASLSTRVGERTGRLLDPVEGPDDGADAVVYLMRHVHAADVDVLEAARGMPTPSVNAVGVLSRADEIGGARPDALDAAAAVARRYRSDPTVRRLCVDVVAVAGLLAETGRTLAPDEFAAVRTLAAAPAETLDEALRSAGRFLADDAVGLGPDQRGPLLDRLGLFGVRLATGLVASGTCGPAELGVELVRRSGLPELRSCLDTRFVERREVLVARSVLLGLRRLLRDEPAPGSPVLAADVMRTLRGAHELRELQALAALGVGDVALPADAVAEGLAVLGDGGPAVRTRLGLPPDCAETACRVRALQVVARWRARAENPLTEHAAAVVSRTVVRTAEGIVAGSGLTTGAGRRTS